MNEIPDRIRVGWFVLAGVEVRARDPRLDEAVAARIQALQDQFPSLGDASTALAAARRLYWDIGIDPSRRRPSSEALLRRVLQGKKLFHVNTAVDAANLASLEMFLPVGLYDLDRIEPVAERLTLTLGAPDAAYEGIGKGEIHLGDRPVLVDARGPFGNPSSDSLRTMVGEFTRRLLFVVYCPRSLPDPDARTLLERSIRIMTEHVDGDSSEIRFA